MDPSVRAPNIVAVATLLKYSDAQRTETREAIAYNLLPEHKIFDWQIGYGGGGLDSGVGLIAIPSLLADLDATGVTSEVAIANIVPKPGFTDFVIYIYDQNGLLDYICQKLNEKQVEYIDLNTWGYINNGFKGSAIISAVFWEHDVFAGDGRFLRNLVGLGAVAVERSKTFLGQDIPGDEAAGARGIPFRQSDIEDAGVRRSGSWVRSRSARVCRCRSRLDLASAPTSDVYFDTARSRAHLRERWAVLHDAVPA